MKKTICLSALLAALALPGSAQTLNDPQAPQNKTELDAGRAKEGKLATRDQHGTYLMKDGIVKAQGAVQFLKEGKMNKVNKEMKLSEGFTIRPNGEITKPDGTSVTLQEGQMMTLDGQIVQAPASTGTTNPGNTETLPKRSGNLTDYGLSGVTGPQEKQREEQKQTPK